jgi:hypothetical protein
MADIYFDDILVDEFGASITDEFSVAFNVNKWFDTTFKNYSLQRNGNTFALYIDNVLYESKTITGISATATIDEIVALFGMLSGTYYLDEMSIFSSVRTSAERAEIIESNITLLPEWYDSSSDYPIDTGATQIDLDTPQRKWNVRKIIGNGASVSGGDYYSDRKITFSRIFKKDGVSISGALTDARNDFINKFITLSDDLYFIRNYNGILQSIQVLPIMGSEKYKNLLISEDFTVSLLCNLPFFSDTLETVTSPFSKTSRYFDKEITVTGLPVPIVFEGTFSSSDTSLTLGVFENYGAIITYAFVAGDVVRFDSGSMRLWVNDVERFNATITGTPFMLLSGVSTLRIEAISDMTLCTVSYTGRYL